MEFAEVMGDCLALQRVVGVTGVHRLCVNIVGGRLQILEFCSLFS
jgi:hypothetical protein